ncbi:hypothetical protein [Nostoc sp.]|uniref:hypothetical protein n=1 Tax=Nostoc sp. TaxID=1180 RepID=UPI002FF56302
MSYSINSMLLVGDHVWANVGGCIALVIEVRIPDGRSEQEALVKYPWGKAYWYKSNELVRTRQPLTEY